MDNPEDVERLVYIIQNNPNIFPVTHKNRKGYEWATWMKALRLCKIAIRIEQYTHKIMSAENGLVCVQRMCLQKTN